MLTFGANVVVSPANSTHVPRPRSVAIVCEGRNLPMYVIPEVVATRKLEVQSRTFIKSYGVEM